VISFSQESLQRHFGASDFCFLSGAGWLFAFFAAVSSVINALTKRSIRPPLAALLTCLFLTITLTQPKLPPPLVSSDKLRRSAKMKSFLCLASYWTLFIVAPTMAIYSVMPLPWGVPIGIVFFFCLLVIGEHALKHWARVWNVE
jgi:hypothetical protein